MNDSQWDAKLKTFLKKTGDDFKRFGADVKAEAQKLLVEVKDPSRQHKLREGLKDVGVWAKKTAEDVATLVETGVKKAEGAITKASDKVTDFVAKPVEPPLTKASPAAPTAPSRPPPVDVAPAPPPVPAPAAAAVSAFKPAAAATAKEKTKKTVGTGPKKRASGAKLNPKKTIGKRSDRS